MREKLIELLKKKYDHYCDQCGVNKQSHYIKNLADYLISHGVIVQEHGRWEEWWPGMSVIMTGEEMLYRCSCCDAKYANVENKRYCPNCGAMMDLEE